MPSPPGQSHPAVPGQPGSGRVTCCVCGVTWDPADPGVLYRSVDHLWWCASYRACQERQHITRRNGA